MSEITVKGIEYEAAKIDRENAWLLFASFAGDIERTALAINVSPKTVLLMADEEGWLERLKPIILLRKSSKPGDLERALNRAVNYVQAHKFRLFIERILHRLTEMDARELDSYLLSVVDNRTGQRVDRLTTRPLADLAAALEKAQAMTYQALGDTGTDRVHRKEDVNAEVSAGELSVAIANAMAKIGGSTSIRAQLFDTQLKAAEEIAATVIRPVKPVDDTYHPDE